uniref:Uncharacterized protein n=1 Tax=Avena sativa TaxID=4498 RepID=A0ACD5W4F7_AVESA
MDPPCKEVAEQPSFYLPDELIEDIFARLPARSAQRCRCLYRGWAAVLSSRSFVERHLRLANRTGSSGTGSNPPSKEAAEQPSFYLPDELIEDIFARLPARSAQRCRCLSLGWAAALSSRSFVDRHLRLANRRDGSRSRSLFFLPDYDSITDTAPHAWSPGRPLVTVRCDDERLRHVAAVTRQCRGLVVLEASRPPDVLDNYFSGPHSSSRPVLNHYVCNPSTGQMTALPKGKEAFGVWPHNHDSLGIGYDASIQKHKPDREMPPGFATDYCTDQSVFAQGHLYWGAQPHRKFNYERVIIYFSITDEVFGILPPPPVQHLYPCRITELDSRLCLFNNTDSYERGFDIWVLHDHGAGTWGIRCRIDLHSASLAGRRFTCSSRIIPLDIVDDGSHILLRPDPYGIRKENSGAHQLYVYNPATGDVEDLLADGGIISHHTVARRVAVPYEESLEPTGFSDTK